MAEKIKAAAEGSFPQAFLKAVGITGRASNKVAVEAANKAIAMFKKKGIDIFVDENFPVEGKKIKLAKMGGEKIDAVFSFGGDGTFLRVARALQEEIPIAGVNCGRLGFLLEFQGNEIEKDIELVIEGKYHTQKRSRLIVEADGKKLPFALNEVAIVPKLSGRLIKYELHIDDWFHKKEGSDGIIISTPTGSTGHSLSAGGPIVVAEAEVFVVTPINPIDWSDRPIVINDKNVVRIDDFKKGSLEVIVDGQERFDAEEKIEIRKGSPITILRTKRALNKLVKVREF